MFTAEEMEKLSGESSVVLCCFEGDVYAVNSGSFVILLSGVDARDVCDILHVEGLEDVRAPDWRILTAKEVDSGENMFLPYYSRRYVPIFPTNMFVCWDMCTSRGRKCADALDSAHDNTMGLDFADITAMYVDGKGRPAYVKAADGKRSQEAESFWFKAGSQVVAVKGKYLSALHSAGVSVLLAYDEERERESVLVLERDGRTIGIMITTEVSGVTVDSKGRDIYDDAVNASRVSVSTALDVFCQASAHDLECPPSSVGDMTANARSRRAVGCLRWSGWTDSDILDAYVRSRNYALYVHAESLVCSCVSYIKDARGSGWSRMYARKSLLAAVSELESILGQLEGEMDLGGMDDRLLDMYDAIADMSEDECAS